MAQAALQPNALSLAERTELVESCRAWATKIALGYRGRGLTWEELEAAALAGLAKAARHYDPERGFQFVTYCTAWVHQALQMDVKDRLRFGVKCVPPEFRFRRATRPAHADEDAPEAHELIPARTEAPHADAASGEFWQKAMRHLTPRERFLLSLRFEDGLTLRQVGNLMGVSRARVQQIEARALFKLKRAIDGKRLEAA